MITFFKKYNYELLFFLFLVICFSFLIFYKGVWLYLDLAWWPKNQAENLIILKQIFYIWENFNVSYFGYDTFLNSFQKIIVLVYVYLLNFLFGVNVGQTLFFLIGLGFGYIYTKKLLFHFNKDNNQMVLALFYCFNPISIYLISQGSIYLAYMAIPAFFYSIIIILDKKKISFPLILLNLISLLFIFSYLRILGMILLILILLFIINFKTLLDKIRGDYKKFFIIFIIYFLMFSIIPFGIQLLKSEGISKGQGNYIQYQKELNNHYFYDDYKNNFKAYELISLNQISANFSSSHGKINIFLSLIFIIIVSLALINQKDKKLYVCGISIILLGFSLLISPKFLSYEIFDKVYNSYLPFFSMNIKWAKVILLIGFIVILSNSQIVKRSSVQYFIIIFIFISILPNILQNEKLKKVENNGLFYKKSLGNNASLFIPGNSENYILTQEPYPLNKGNNSYHRDLLTSNPRLVNKKTIQLYKKIKSNLHTNSSLLNLKDIFIFKNIRNPKDGEFDFFPIRDYISESNKAQNELSKNKDLYIKQNNNSFIQYRLKNANRYEYYLYSPSRITRYEVDDFFGKDIDITKKIVNIDSNSFKKPVSVDTFKVPESNKDIHIEYKKSVLDPTKIYAKFSDVDINNSFLIQLNQTFGMNWKIKWITQDEYNEKKCIDKLRQYNITDNSFCNYKTILLNISNIKFLNKQTVKEENHFEGNFVGNTWLIEPDDIPENISQGDNLYAVIIYQKQIYYTWALILSGLTFITLILLAIIQEIKIYINRKQA